MFFGLSPLPAPWDLPGPSAGCQRSGYSPIAPGCPGLMEGGGPLDQSPDGSKQLSADPASRPCSLGRGHRPGFRGPLQALPDSHHRPRFPLACITIYGFLANAATIACHRSFGSLQVRVFIWPAPAVRFDARLRGLMSSYVAPVLVPTARVTAVTIDSAFWSLTPNRRACMRDFGSWSW